MNLMINSTLTVPLKRSIRNFDQSFSIVLDEFLKYASVCNEQQPLAVNGLSKQVEFVRFSWFVKEISSAWHSGSVNEHCSNDWFDTVGL